MQPITLQCMLLKPVGGCNAVRIEEPHMLLSALPGIQIQHFQESAKLLPKELPNKIFLWQRPILTCGTHLPMLKRLMELDYLIITEFDDHPEKWPAIEANNYLNFRGC